MRQDAVAAVRLLTLWKAIFCSYCRQALEELVEKARTTSDIHVQLVDKLEKRQ
jgi:hypothetical protein